jgi:hypothetical protein
MGPVAFIAEVAGNWARIAEKDVENHSGLWARDALR